MQADQTPRGPTSASTKLTDAQNYERLRTHQREATSLEVLVAWSHAPKTPIRYRALDVSAGGMRIRSMLPIREGMIGAVLSTVPRSSTPNRSFQVMWCKKVPMDDGSGVAYEAGLRFET